MASNLRHAGSRGAIVWILMAVLVSLAASCSDPSASQQAGPRKVRIQLNWVPEPEFGGLYAAVQDGLMREAGFEVEIIKDTGGTAVPQLIAQGVCDLGFVSGDQILTLREQGGDLVAVFNVFDITPYGFMVHAAEAPASIEALWKGPGTLACESGLPVIKLMQAKYGPSGRKLVPWGGATANFLADPSLAVQCFITSEPPLMDLKKVPVKVFRISEAGYNPYTEVLAMRRGGMDDLTLRRFMAAHQEGWRRYLADPGRYNPAIAALNPAMSLEAMNLGAERMREFLLTPWTRAHGLGSMDPQRWQAMVDALAELGIIGVRPDPASLMHWVLDPPPAEGAADQPG
ncbi:MAG: hypothetical protein RLZZ558_1005 [Planctomycetota bacterium]|jgi:NitT/TauT family transport system substrate-binding protein